MLILQLLVCTRLKDLNHMRDIIENKIRTLSNVIETELMTVLKTKKEDQIVYLNKEIADNNTNYG
jgi:Na+/H+-dicarboxylate symporter